MSQKNKMLLFGILSVVWSGIIFSFSLQPANQSASLSGGLLSYLLQCFRQLTGLSIPMETVHNVFRKLAHFGEFFILGGFSFGFFKSWNKPACFAVLYSALIAFTDELLQFFTGQGRAMRFSDMGIDTLGALCAVILLWFVKQCFFKKKNNFSEM